MFCVELMWQFNEDLLNLMTGTLQKRIFMIGGIRGDLVIGDNDCLT